MKTANSTPTLDATLTENLKSEFLNPKFPLHLFPAPFRDQIHQLSAPTGAPLEFTPTAFLASLSAAHGDSPSMSLPSRSCKVAALPSPLSIRLLLRRPTQRSRR